MTPLRNWATTYFIAGVVFLYVAAFVGGQAILAWQARDERIALFWTVVLLGVVGASLGFVNGVNLNRADTLLGDTFRRCPLCLGSNVAFDVALFRLTDRVICRDCHASWEFKLNVLSMELNRLRLVDYGIALREEEKNTVPNTDDPEQWQTWAKERFKQGTRPSPVSSPEQKQTIFCRFCGHPNLPDANFCSACGRKLKA